MEEGLMTKRRNGLKNIIEGRPQKKKKADHELQDLLEDLLKNQEFDLYSTRYRKQVWNIIEWMISHDYVDVDVDDKPRDDDYVDLWSRSVIMSLYSGPPCEDSSPHGAISSLYSGSHGEDSSSQGDLRPLDSNDDIRSLDSNDGDIRSLDSNDDIRSLDSNDDIRSLDSNVASSSEHDESCDDVVSTNYDIRGLRKAIALLADKRKTLSASEEKHGASFHSICYPLDQECIGHEGPHLKLELSSLHQDANEVMLSGMPEGKASFKDKTKHDVVSLLFSGESTLVTQTTERIVFKPNIFRGKYVLVCCITAPVLFASCGFQSLLNVCHELSSERRNDFEMVMVASMHILADTREVFDQVFSAFPSHCLAVPYEDWERRERIRNLLSPGRHRLQCSVYDTEGLFLKSYYIDGPKEFPYGAEAFPFTKEMVRKVHKKSLQLRKEDSLENLLRLHESSPDVTVYEFNGGQEKRILEVMENKHVGLYVCCEGNLIPLLHKLFNRCKEQQKKFEIVVLYLPLLSKLEPALFKKSIDGLLDKHEIRGWWCLPFNNSVSLRLWGLTRKADSSLHGDFDTKEEEEDKLIIVGPDGKISDMYGAQVIKHHGIDVFPFTRAAVVKKQMRKVWHLKLESSLLPGHLFRGADPTDIISADTLLASKKKIIIYLGKPNTYTANGVRFDFHGLVSQYKKMKKSSDDFEVVFVEYPYIRQIPEVNVRKYSKMPWYIHRPCDGNYAPLGEKLQQLVSAQSLVGFAEDGRICSVKYLAKLNKSNTPGLCLEDTLFRDLHQLFHYDDYAVI